MTVYADILLFVHTVTDSALLWLTARLCRCEPSGRRFLLGLVLAVGYGTVACFWTLPAWLGWGGGVTLWLFTVFCVFGWHGHKVFLRRAAVYLVVNLSYVGLLLACQTWIPGAGEMIDVRSGAVLYNFPLPYLFVGIAVLCVGQMALDRLFRKRLPDRCVKTCRIVKGDTSLSVTCLMDSGNRLRDGISGRPVVVVQKRALNEIAHFSYETDKSIRYIPYQCAGGLKGVLPAFKPDAFFCDGVPYQVLVAVDESGTCGDGEVQGIMPVLSKGEL